MKAKELRQKSLSELNEALQAELTTRFKLRMQHGNGQLSKTDLLSKNKKAIAQLKTLVQEKRVEEAKA